jgi:hypothetical protein
LGKATSFCFTFDDTIFVAAAFNGMGLSTIARHPFVSAPVKKTL